MLYYSLCWGWFVGILLASRSSYFANIVTGFILSNPTLFYNRVEVSVFLVGRHTLVKKLLGFGLNVESVENLVFGFAFHF